MVTCIHALTIFCHTFERSEWIPGSRPEFSSGATGRGRIRQIAFADMAPRSEQFERRGEASVSALVALFATLLMLAPSCAGRAMVVNAVTALIETDPVAHDGDAADDAAVWIHPRLPGRSTIIGTDKLGGLAVYSLSGRRLHLYSGITPNNVDLRYNFPLAGRRVTLVTASDPTSDSILIYKVEPLTRGLRRVGTIRAGISLYGLCMYHSPRSDRYFAFNNDNNGTVQQWKLSGTAAGNVTGTLVREFDVGGTTEGCVADDQLRHFYVSEEAVGIWKYSAEPGAGTARSKVDSTGARGNLTADVEGLTIYYARNRAGYLLASSQGDDSFVVYERQRDNAYVKSFVIAAGNVDGVSHTDGIDVTNFGLGNYFPRGVFVAQDDDNGPRNQNFKLVPWERIARSKPTLITDVLWDPREVGR